MAVTGIWIGAGGVQFSIVGRADSFGCAGLENSHRDRHGHASIGICTWGHGSVGG